MIAPGTDEGDNVMEMLVDTSREYWRGVLAAGGFTAVPRWTQTPEPGVAEYLAPIPDDVWDTLAVELAVPLGTALLAAHAAVLAALSGETEVTTGYLADPDAGPLPCRLTTRPHTWRELLAQAERAEAELLAHRHVDVAALAAELGRPVPAGEVAFDPAGLGGEPAGELLLTVGLAGTAAGPALRLRYRTDALDATAAARIAGYHLTALDRLATEPDAGHDRHSLLSAEELDLQLDGLAGPTRELPDQRFHQLFEQRVRQHPDAVAAEHGDRRWTYAELNAHANRLARTLLERGLHTEGVVAVAAERNLDWTAAVIAIFKAGGVYLPVDPRLPGGRIGRVLDRAECRLVLTEPASTTALDEALATRPEVTKILFEDAYAAQDDDTDPGLAVGPDQLAYIYFTSGSTGEPKGAMCEHAGMLNHLQAKIADLEIDEGQTVAQTAPQSFDISLWQLISALLVGGRTLLVPQDVILDVARFVDTIADAGVHVAQLVPSYLEVVLTHLEQNPRELPELHCCSVTGEALKLELAQRWFAMMPGIKLVNAYGLTETSDDTNHEVMRAAPTGRSVPLGPAVQNVRVYVVDDKLRPVPLGAPGAIVFSGVCVGRGYINDPDRTAAAYLTDPHRPGERLYQAGDFGRWRPDGKLEFLGRRDGQVKISGFRIEIGEIENTLLRVPGVRDGAVVVAEPAGGAKHLVAFYAADRPLPVELLRERLGASLPVYMVPTAFHWRDELPLTANGKIDKKVLTALAAELDVAVDEVAEPPVTPTEQRLAAAWAPVLGVPVEQIGRHDNFFERGGTSLSAVKVVLGLKRAVSLTEITRNPVLADLAALLDDHAGQQSASGLLQELAAPEGELVGTLVCFPYAGGNAVNYRPLAGALRGSGLAVYAVELPGHDPTAADGAGSGFATTGHIVEQLVEEITRRGLTGLLLWGHSSGSALAVATAAALQRRGVQVRRVFVAAQLPGTPATRRAAAAELATTTDGEIVTRLTGDTGYPELGELDPPRAARTAAAYRHDCESAHRWFVEHLEHPPSVRLSTPVTVVVAADDPSTAGHPERYREWERLAERVQLTVLPDGGHHFLRTRPVEAARLLLPAALAPAVDTTHTALPTL